MDVEKTIQFLLEQQARFDARFEARQAQFEASLEVQKARFEEEVSRINSVILEIARAQEKTNEILFTLAARHVELTESHNATEQTLNALASTVERHISSHT
jgi:hypothetical protein